MKIMQVEKPSGPFVLAERPVPEPGAGEVRVRVHACGICHSDSLTVDAHWPGIAFPRAPGHEIAGVVDAVGAGAAWKTGARVGVGWNGGFDGTCDSCRRGDFVTCVNGKIPGISFDGGYAQYVIVQQGVLARIPDVFSFAEAAPLLCAGVTTFNSLRHTDARPGDVVAVLGIGGLGHLGVQFSAKMGFKTVAIARGRDKEALARELGAVDYIDSSSEDVAARLQAHGGARVVLATATNAQAMAQTIGGLGIDGTLVVLGASPEPIPVPGLALIGGRRKILGWPSGSAIDSEETMRFAALTGVKPMIETAPLADAQAAYDKMMRNEARFRMVLTLA